MPNYKRFRDYGGYGSPAEGYEERMFEGRGPGGAAVLVNCLTKDKERTASGLRAIFERHGCRMAEDGSVAGLFVEKGLLVIDREANDIDEDAMVMLALEGGAEDVVADDDRYEVVTVPDKFEMVKDMLRQEGYGFASAGIRRLPGRVVNVKGKDAAKLRDMMDAFEKDEEVREVYANFDIG